MPTVAITLLNGFAATVDGVPVGNGAWRLRKARDLVKLLALAPGQRLHREQAMDALWSDRTPAAAANNLYQAVFAARRALGATAIEVRDELLFLDAEVDVVRAERAARDARRTGTASAYRAALSLLEGELLPENRYDDWASDRRDALSALRDELAGALERLGATDGLASLPAATSSFVGREHELAELRSLLARSRLLTLTGTGGAGKTRLALQLARAAEPGYADGAALVELAPIADPAQAVEAVADALDVRALPGYTTLEAVVQFLASRTLLLVVDNCEHLLGATAPLVETVLRAAPRLTVLTTTREPLRLPGEVVFRVPSLPIPDPERLPDVDELLRYPSVQLFVERATATGTSFSVDEENAADVARICFRLDGLPLALELAAGRMGALSPSVVAARLDDRFRLLRASTNSAPTRQQTLEATLQWSHDLLEPPEQTLFRRLAVFSGSFGLDAVEAVCAGDGLEARDVADLLARLVEKSLVALDGQLSHGRYRQLESIRLYAQERLAEAGETEALVERHAGWALALAESGATPEVLDADAANLRAALDALVARAPEGALRLCVSLRPFWLRRIELAEAERHLASALAASADRGALRADALLSAAALDWRGGALSRARARAEESLELAAGIGDARRRWNALQFLGEFGATYTTDAAAVNAMLEQAIELARDEQLAAEEGLGLYALGVARWLAGEPDGEELIERSLELLVALPDPGAPVRAPLNVAEIRVDRPAVTIVLEETLQPHLAVTCAAATAFVQANLAAVARARGDFARAAELLDGSAQRFEQLGDATGRAYVLARRGYLALAQGETAAAARSLGAAFDLRRELGDRRGAGLALTGLAMVATAEGDHDAAGAQLAEARELFHRAGDRWGLVNALWRTADLGLARSDPDAAEAALREARAVLDEPQLERWIAHTDVGLAEVALARGEPGTAVALLTDAAARYAAASDPAGAAAARERLEAARAQR